MNSNRNGALPVGEAVGYTCSLDINFPITSLRDIVRNEGEKGAMFLVWPEPGHGPKQPAYEILKLDARIVGAKRRDKAIDVARSSKGAIIAFQNSAGGLELVAEENHGRQSCQKLAERFGVFFQRSAQTVPGIGILQVLTYSEDAETACYEADAQIIPFDTREESRDRAEVLSLSRM